MPKIARTVKESKRNTDMSEKTLFMNIKSMTRKIRISNKFKKYFHKPSNGGKPIDIDVGYERFLGSVLRYSSIPSLYTLIVDF